MLMQRIISLAAHGRAFHAIEVACVQVKTKRWLLHQIHQGQPVYGFNGNDLSASESVGAI